MQVAGPPCPGRFSAQPAGPPHPGPLPKGEGEKRSGFTLVEMLVVIAIIGMLAGMGLAAMFKAQESARASHTRALITKLNSQMAQKWESYRTRRLPISFDPNNAAKDTPQEVAVLQRDARRELMRMELPDRYKDLLFTPTRLVDTSGNAVFTSLQRAYLSRAGLRDASGTIDTTRYDTIRAENQSAECLYMIMTTGMGEDGDTDVVFSPKDVADTDNDDMPEFIDGWGTQIEFIRWPAGFVSDLQPDAPGNAQTAPAGRKNPPPNRDVIKNHDPFDPTQTETWDGTSTPPRGYELFPLIVSAGPDGGGRSNLEEAFGIFFLHSDPLAGDSDPYATFRDAPPPGQSEWQRAEIMPQDKPAPQYKDFRPFGGGPDDNIHNHMLDLRK